MSGISSKGSNGTADNKLKFNGKEEQAKSSIMELSYDYGLNIGRQFNGNI
jgi:hypothetical protein